MKQKGSASTIKCNGIAELYNQPPHNVTPSGGGCTEKIKQLKPTILIISS